MNSKKKTDQIREQSKADESKINVCYGNLQILVSWKTVKEEHAEAEVCLLSGDEHEEARNIEYANGEKTVGQRSSVGLVPFAAHTKNE